MQPTGTESAPASTPAVAEFERGALEAVGRVSAPRAPAAWNPNDASGRSLAARALVGLLVLGCELVGLGLVVDTGRLSESSMGWMNWLGMTPQAAQAGIAWLAAWIILGWAGIQRAFRAEPWASGAFLRWNRLILHGVAFLMLVAACDALFSSPTRPTTRTATTLIAVASLSLGVATVVTWGANVFPGRLWRRLFLETRGALLAAAGVGITAWYAGQWANEGWRPLAGGTLWLVERFLGFFFQDRVVERATLIVGTARFQVEIAPACSGYEGMALIAVFLTAFCVAYRKILRFPQAFALLPVGIAAAWLLNAVRIALLIAIGTLGWPEIALGGFHSQGGWLAFNGVALLLVAAATRVPWFLRRETPKSRESALAHVEPAAAKPAAVDANPAAAYLMPFLATLAVGMIGASLRGGVESPAWKFIGLAARLTATAGALWWWRAGLRDARWKPTWAALLAGVGVYAVWILLHAGRNVESVLPTTSPDGVVIAGLFLGLRLVSYVIVTPLVEELAFRGYLLRRVICVDFEQASWDRYPWLALLVSAVLFGAFHGRNWLPGVIAGLAYGALYLRKSRIGDPLAAHAVTNGLLALHAIGTGNDAAWS